MSIAAVTACPKCGLSLVNADPHCPSPTCAWVRCTCDAVVDQRTGRFTGGKR